MSDALSKLCELIRPPDRPVHVHGPRLVDPSQFPQDYWDLTFEPHDAERYR